MPQNFSISKVKRIITYSKGIPMYNVFQMYIQIKYSNIYNLPCGPDLGVTVNCVIFASPSSLTGQIPPNSSQ